MVQFGLCGAIYVLQATRCNLRGEVWYVPAYAAQSRQCPVCGAAGSPISTSPRTRRTRGGDGRRRREEPEIRASAPQGGTEATTG
eukprot:372114-Pyramimonas_sp.AAC.1